MNCFVTGGAGFLGSHLVDDLLDLGHDVTIYDNLITGKVRNLQYRPLRTDHYHFVRGDIMDREYLTRSMRGSDIVFHLAANADVRSGWDHPYLDMNQNTFGTWSVLEAMRISRVNTIAFASSASVYGDTKVRPTPEHAPFPVQTSLYGASKLAAEGFIQAYAEGRGIKAFVFRFVSLLGERYHHGHVIDFYQQLRANPALLKVLGDGSQRKSYLYVKDAVSAMLAALRLPYGETLNVGSDETCTVRDSIAWICDHLKVYPKCHFEDRNRGWVGDAPHIQLNCTKLRSLGWKPTLTIQESIIRTLDYLAASEP